MILLVLLVVSLRTCYEVKDLCGVLYHFYKNMSTENGKVPIFILIFSLPLQCHCRTERLELSCSSSSGLVCLDLKADLSAAS